MPDWKQLQAHPGLPEYLHYITLLCGTRSLTAMESRAIAGGLSADHQLQAHRAGVTRHMAATTFCMLAQPLGFSWDIHT